MAASNGHSVALTLVDHADVDTDQVLRSLASPRRRHVLALLSDRAAPMPLADLATDVTARELDADCDDLPEETVKSVQVSLYHTHGPVLEEAGLVQCDHDEQTIELTDVGRDLGALDRLPAIE